MYELHQFWQFVDEVAADYGIGLQNDVSSSSSKGSVVRNNSSGRIGDVAHLGSVQQWLQEHLPWSSVCWAQVLTGCCYILYMAFKGRYVRQPFGCLSVSAACWSPLV